MRRLVGGVSLLMLAFVLVACGGEDDDEPTVVPTATEATGGLATTVVTEIAISTPTTPVTSASPEAIAASPVVVTASPVASPAGTSGATPIASPMASPVAVAPTPRTEWVLQGTVLLPGVENQDFVLSGDGCVGLGEYAGLETGQQVVVKDAAGGIIGLTTLSASGSSSECIWTFEVEVPVSEFYTLSMPMLFERSYSDADIVVVDGRLQITLP